MKKHFCCILLFFLISQTNIYAASFSISETTVTPSYVNANEHITLSCRVSHSDGAENIRVVAASLSSSKANSSYPVLYDDGTNGDIQAGDGIYSLEITAPGTPGEASVVFIAVDSANNEIETDPIIFTVQ